MGGQHNRSFPSCTPPGKGYCFNGDCPTLGMQCEKIWGYGGTAADRQCYEQFNTKGSINGHCGTDPNGHFIKCEAEYVYFALSLSLLKEESCIVILFIVTQQCRLRYASMQRGRTAADRRRHGSSQSTQYAVDQRRIVRVQVSCL